VGLAVLEETVEGKLIARAEEVGAHLRTKLDALRQRSAIVGDVRGLGMLNAIEIVANKETRAMLPRQLDVIGSLQTQARAEGLLIYGRRTHGGKFGDWLMITPPLIATTTDIDEIVEGLARALKSYEAELRAAHHVA
jgi:4-aminobutyrate aminotransferase-like enzyme